MFNLLVSASLRSRLLVLAAAVVLIVYGSFAVSRLPVDVFPDLNRPTVVLMTEAEGLAPQEIEQLVTYPIESAMGGMPGVVRVRSVSDVSFSIVYVEFGWETEIYRAMQTLYYEDRIVAEGGSAVGIAALQTSRLPPLRGPVATVVTGRNLDMRLHADIMQGRDVRLGDMVLEGRPYAA